MSNEWASYDRITYTDQPDIIRAIEEITSVDGDTQTIYEGVSRAGEGTGKVISSSDALWKIRRVILTNLNSDPADIKTSVSFADNSTEPNKVWDDRTTYTYTTFFS